MKLTKRLFALALVLCMLACLCVSVCAVKYKDNDESKGYDDESTITITKNYELTNNETTSPAETFYIVRTSDAVSVAKNDGFTGTAPDLPTTTEGELNFVAKVAYTEGDAGKTTDKTKTFSISLPSLGASGYTQVGEYTYWLQEVAGNTAGVTYHGEKFKLVVTVINDGDNKLRIAAVHTEKSASDEKMSTITNTYSAGELKITKYVTGKLGDKAKKFDFTVTLTAPNGKTVRSSVKYSIAGGTEQNATFNDQGVATITGQLSNEETIAITNIPYGVTYSVSESLEENSPYTVYVGEGNDKTQTSSADGTISAVTASVRYENNYEGVIDMGVSLDSLPYILALVLACGGAVVLFTRKRHIEE